MCQLASIEAPPSFRKAAILSTSAFGGPPSNSWADAASLFAVLLAVAWSDIS
jgi:hypothetical protein